MSAQDHIAGLERSLPQASPQELAEVLGQLRRLEAIAWARLAATAANGAAHSSDSPPDTLLDAKEAARRLGTSVDYLYRHAPELPFTVRPGGRRLRFSARGIERYIRLRQGNTDAS